jgi:glycosidase
MIQRIQATCQSGRRHVVDFPFKNSARAAVLLGAIAPVLAAVSPADAAVDTSSPVILQWFESSYKTIENRMADVFVAGYGAVWTPPPGRADISNYSVGYDVYDRFDLGSAGNPTLYGTETGIKQMATTLHRAGLDLHVDFVMNHNGYSGTGDQGSRDAFNASGGYPGFVSYTSNDPDGDFNSAYSYGDVQGRLAGLIDIAHYKNNTVLVRNPVPGYNNIPAGTTAWNGRLANVPTESNRRFYPDLNGPYIEVYDPRLYPDPNNRPPLRIYQFNTQNPMAGDPTQENATGYLMRNAQWLIQSIGVDGLRIDAAKHVDGYVLDYLDRSVYRANPRNLLDGSTKHVFSYSEVYDGNPDYLLTHVRKDINNAYPHVVGGNRDTMDFKLYFAMKEKLEYGTNPGWDNWDDKFDQWGNRTQRGLRYAWYDLKDADLDYADDHLHNGSAGVKFVNNHDVYKPFQLSNVAHAYTLMMPGNTAVYFNGKEFGDNRDFPKEGNGSALSVGNGGSSLTKLISARTTHGRGNYAERWVDGEGVYVFERVSSAVVGLSNRTDGGYDTRKVEVGFAPGTLLTELSGNHQGWTDPYGNIPEVIRVFSENGKNYANITIPRNVNANGDWTGLGYIIYGLPTPQAAQGLQVSNVAQTLAGNTTPTSDYQNGTQRQTNVSVITGDSTQLRLKTNEVRLLGSDDMRDIYADGDNALIKVDGGVDINGNGRVDFTDPGSVSYGFERFGTKSSALIGPDGISGARGDGEFLQNLDTSKLSEGYHFIEARAFRHRTDGGPEVFSEFKQVIYVDRLKPVSSVSEVKPYDGGTGNNDFMLRSDDMTANGMHVFLNLPANLTNAQIMALLGDGNRASQIDRDIFKYGFGGMAKGNNALTVVTFEVTGNSNIQRLTGINPASGFGVGVGDLNHDGQVDENDMGGTSYGLEHVLYTRNGEFNPSADANADGLIDNRDLFALEQQLKTGGASPAIRAKLRQIVLNRGNINGVNGADQWDIDELRHRLGKGGDNWYEDLNAEGVVDAADVAVMVQQVLASQFGDFNLDLKIDAADLQILADNWQQGDRGYAGADGTGDAFVTSADLDLLKANWGYGVTGPFESIYAAAERIGFAAVPEPSSLCAVALAFGAGLRRRRKVN